MQDRIYAKLLIVKIKNLKKHPLPLRWNHWINFPLLTIMIVSGLAIYWTNSDYLLPGEWLDKIGLGGNLGLGMGWHFAFAILFIINGIFYSFFLIKTGHYRYLIPDRKSLREAGIVFLHDIKVWKKPLPEQIKYNAAQRITYSGIFLMGVAATLTGLAIYKPAQLNWLLAALGGYKAARIEHFIIMALFVGFFFVHIGQVIKTGWNNFRAMVTGLEVKPEVKDEQ